MGLMNGSEPARPGQQLGNGNFWQLSADWCRRETIVRTGQIDEADFISSEFSWFRDGNVVG
ncbi:MAG: hypothetical protein WBD51_22005, partial [Burkholderiaceae bacterium]